MASGSSFPPAPTRDELRSRRKRVVRKVTLNLDREPKKERTRLAILGPSPADLAELQRLRPRTRGECEDSLRPCPFVGCQYNLFLDVASTGNLTLNFPDLEPEQIIESCALDVADQGGETLEFVGECLNVTRERIRQIEVRALFKLQRRGARGFAEFSDAVASGGAGARKLVDPDIERAKGRYRCGRCGEYDHNARTCPNAEGADE